MQNTIIYKCFTLHTKMGKDNDHAPCSVSTDVEVEAQYQLANCNIYLASIALYIAGAALPWPMQV